jgi:hypothetical protein
MRSQFPGQATFVAATFPAFWQELCDTLPTDQPFRIMQVADLKVLRPFAPRQRHRYARVLLAHALATQDADEPHILRRGQVYVLTSRS